ncbi:ATP-binding cassette domain-containing protein [Pullulanibacillus sp. KACC 23026]|uniref:ABC transporter ATP-binding protein n=1 Tax=Pullulanibacillus sp. KACC 23026 TaxID=3028315 RepID=UPI0023AEE9CC|nr:ATP-binding cassette domain-containing protein [Pullulanibacillus sp. KACC 23026]WEG11129.1 ATP-binding cassette domain-containing protein [Pullulanibacillus sp. KACC 23026]
MIDVQNLSKRYGRKQAVDGLSFKVQSSCVTGFLGPNGSGKSTTLRMVLGLDKPDGGKVLIQKRSFDELRYPLRTVGAMLDATAIDGGRTAFSHLKWIARSNRIDYRRVEEVLEQVGLQSVSRQRISRFSLGMKARLGIAAALLGDPEVLILDEPLNGLDPEGVRWIRSLCRMLAAEGRTVFLSSHLMSEMEKTADHLIILGRGRLIADANISQLLKQHQTGLSLEDVYMKLSHNALDYRTEIEKGDGRI